MPLQPPLSAGFIVYYDLFTAATANQIKINQMLLSYIRITGGRFMERSGFAVQTKRLFFDVKKSKS